MLPRPTHPGRDVGYEIGVFFRLASRGARLAGRLSLVLQWAATRGYVAAIRRAARGQAGRGVATERKGERATAW